MGSNAIRFIIFATGGKELSEEYYKRSVIRLGDDAFRFGKFTKETIKNVISEIREFKSVCQSYQCSSIYGVATSAVRESENGQELLDEIERHVSIKIKKITGNEEAEIIARAVYQKIKIDHFLHVDLGGGSLECIEFSDGKLGLLHSFPIGNNRFLDQLSGTDIRREKQLETIIDTAFSSHFNINGHFKTISLTGGSSNYIAEFLLGSNAEKKALTLSAETFVSFKSHLQGRSVEQLQHELNIRKDRAETIGISHAIFSRLIEKFGAEEIIVPFTGLREGLVSYLSEEEKGNE